jgi:hypothetical protein
MNHRSLTAFTLLSSLFVTACVDDDDLAGDTLAIEGGSPPTSTMVAVAATIQFNELTPGGYIASGVRIGPRHVLTAGGPMPGDVVELYRDARGTDPTTRRRIVSMLRYSTAASEQWRPKVMVLDADVTVGAPAVLAWSYPGPGADVQPVSAGAHGGEPNPTFALRRADDRTVSIVASDQFRVEGDLIEPTDGGGPVWHEGRVLGVMQRVACSDPALCVASVPYHLDFILGAIGWAWPYGPSSSGAWTGAILEVVDDASERVCQYACANSRSCVAYSVELASGSCRLMSSRTRFSLQPGWRSGTR